MNLLLAFQAFFDYCIRSDGIWITHDENYILQVLQYKPQEDSYSCGAYVLSTFSHFAQDKGKMPSRTFSPGYCANLTEAYRWASIEYFLNGVIEFSKLWESSKCISELDVLLFLMEKICRCNDYQPTQQIQSTDNTLTEPVWHTQDLVEGIYHEGDDLIEGYSSHRSYHQSYVETIVSNVFSSATDIKFRKRRKY